MRILFLSTSSGSRGGGELYLYHLGEELAAEGHQVGLWASSHPRMDPLCERFSRFGDVLRAPYVNTYDHWLRSLSLPLPRLEAHRLERQWTSWKPDLLHLNKQNLEDGLDLLPLLARVPVPSVSTVHLTQMPSTLGARFGSARDAAVRHAIPRYRGTWICISRTRAMEMRRQFLLSCLEVIPNGVTIPDPAAVARQRDQARRDLGVPPGETLVVAVARFVEQKQPLLFLDMAQRLHAADPRTKFLWVGATPEILSGAATPAAGSLLTAWNTRIRQASLEQAVMLQPWRDDLSAVWAAADAYFHTAAFEGLPFALLEAMAYGVPVAVTGSLVSEVGFLNDDNALIFGGDHDWLPLFLSGEGRASRIEAARNLVLEHYSVERMARSHLRLYERTLAESRLPELAAPVAAAS